MLLLFILINSPQNHISILLIVTYCILLKHQVVASYMHSHDHVLCDDWECWLL